MENLSSTDLLGLLDKSELELVQKKIAFTIDDKDFTADIAVKRLGFDEVVNQTRDKDVSGMLMADLHKIRVLETIYNADTQAPFFADLAAVGKPVPSIIDAMYKASEAVNDFSGKQQMKHLTKMNSGTNSSAAESAEEQSEKQNET